MLTAASPHSRLGPAKKTRRDRGRVARTDRPRRAGLVRRLCRGESGTSAVEFAIVLPLLALFLMSAIELFRYGWTVKKMISAANQFGEMLSSAQQGPTASDFSFIGSAGMVINPQVLNDAQARGVNWPQIQQATYTSVVFTPTVAGCTVLCTYKANVAWSAGAQQRPCGMLQAVPDQSAYSPTTLPQTLFGPSSVIVVDVSYAYQPLFHNGVLGNTTVVRSAFFVPRYLDPLPLGDVSANPSIATRCPGF